MTTYSLQRKFSANAQRWPSRRRTSSPRGDTRARNPCTCLFADCLGGSIFRRYQNESTSFDSVRAHLSRTGSRRDPWRGAQLFGLFPPPFDGYARPADAKGDGNVRKAISPPLATLSALSTRADPCSAGETAAAQPPASLKPMARSGTSPYRMILRPGGRLIRSVRRESSAASSRLSRKTFRHSGRSIPLVACFSGHRASPTPLAPTARDQDELGLRPLPETGTRALLYVEGHLGPAPVEDRAEPRHLHQATAFRPQSRGR